MSHFRCVPFPAAAREHWVRFIDALRDLPVESANSREHADRDSGSVFCEVCGSGLGAGCAVACTRRRLAQMPERPQYGFWTQVGMPCPHCKSEQTKHSGFLHQDMPDSPKLDPPVEILRCRNCRQEFRVDGQPYDEAARQVAWFRHECEQRGVVPPGEHNRVVP